MLNGRTLLLCPQCHSMKVYSELGGMTGALYRCLECNYLGSVIIERELSDEEIQAIEEQGEAEGSAQGTGEQAEPGKPRQARRLRP